MELSSITAVLNILKGNHELVDDTFKLILRLLQQKTDLAILIKNLIQNHPASLSRMVRDLGSPFNDPKGFMMYIESQIQRAQILSLTEYKAIKECFEDTYPNVLSTQEKTDYITRWVLGKKKKSKALHRVLEFIKTRETTPSYSHAPSYDPPNYYGLYSTAYKRPSDYIRDDDYKRDEYQGGGKKRKHQNRRTRNRKSSKRTNRSRGRRRTSR